MSGQPTKSQFGIVNDDCGHRYFNRVINQGAERSFLCRVSHELVSIETLSAQRNKQIPALYDPRVGADPANKRIVTRVLTVNCFCYIQHGQHSEPLNASSATRRSLKRNESLP